MTGAVPVFELEAVVLTRVRVNRGDSGSPQWAEFFFADPELAKTFYNSELVENRCGVPEKGLYLRDVGTGTCYKVPESLVWKK